ncbi:protachykinin-like [Scleropages formosus]|uniref:Protachykinin-like n=1 Tax=Scleropages formosus TaxID=113540 RepID=A0A0N8K1H6_SCLFO|nr:protachykinin-1 [Scleropages formosus]KPP74961.1 protachykinin-like [Scleropages formosus]
MKLLLSVVVLSFLVAELWCEERAPIEDLTYWASSNERPDEWLASDSFREMLRRMTRKPRPHQFFGLMGKRSPTNPQITRKRQKLNSFVGLMGKRSQEEPDSYEWNTILNYGRR